MNLFGTSFFCDFGASYTEPKEARESTSISRDQEFSSGVKALTAVIRSESPIRSTIVPRCWIEWRSLSSRETRRSSISSSSGLSSRNLTTLRPRTSINSDRGDAMTKTWRRSMPDRGRCPIEDAGSYIPPHVRSPGSQEDLFPVPVACT